VSLHTERYLRIFRLAKPWRPEEVFYQLREAPDGETGWPKSKKRIAPERTMRRWNYRNFDYFRRKRAKPIAPNPDKSIKMVDGSGTVSMVIAESAGETPLTTPVS
jgi:hypothetical protein